MKAKKPGDLKIARRKRKPLVLSAKVRKGQPWYASALAQISISAIVARGGKDK